MFRQAFLLSQYSFIYEQYFKCSDAYYTQYFFDSWSIKQTTKQLKNTKISSEKSLRKNEKEVNVGTDLTSV